MPYDVTVLSVHPEQNHEAGFAEREAAERYAQEVLGVYLQHLAQDTRRSRREKEVFAAEVRRQLTTTHQLTIPPTRAETLGWEQLLITVGGRQEGLGARRLHQRGGPLRGG